MRVETLEYGDDPEAEYKEDWCSFKVFTVWSQPGVKKSSIEDTKVRQEDVRDEDKRLATAIELPGVQGGFLFIEKPNPGADWIETIFEMLRNEGWRGQSLKDLRINSRGDIKIGKGEGWTAVIDKKTQRAFHNKNMKKGKGKVEDLENFKK